MKKVYINENKIKLLAESNDEVTFYEFLQNTKQFLKDLLKDPANAKVSELFIKHGISNDDLIKKMKKIGLLKSKENIIEVPIEEETVKPSGKLRAKHTIQYLIPRKRFNEKMKELHKQLFGENKSFFKDEKKMKEDILNSTDGEVYKIRGGINLYNENTEQNALDFNKKKLLIEALSNKMEYKKSRKLAWDFSILGGGVSLNEGIVNSYSPDFIANRLIRCYGLSTEEDWEERGFNGTLKFYKARNTNEEDVGDYVQIDITVKNTEDEVGRIKNFLKFCGWYKATEESDGDKVSLIFEKEHMKDEEAVKDFNAAYHVTSYKKVEKILRQGLTPKHNDRLGYHPSRVYLFPDNTCDVINLRFVGEMLHYQTYHKPRNEDYAILKVDLSNANDIKFYLDPNADGAVFTYDNIPPNLITVIDIF